MALGLLSWVLQILVSNFIWLNRFSLNHEIFMYFAWMLVKGIDVIRVWIYFKFNYKQRYIFYRHSSKVWIPYGKLLIKTDASCTCLIIIYHLIWFAGPRGKYHVWIIDYGVFSIISVLYSLCWLFYSFNPPMYWPIKPHVLYYYGKIRQKTWFHNSVFTSWLTFPYTAPLFSPPV